MSFGVDYAWHGSDLSALVSALKAHHVTFVCRYLSHSSGKNVTHAEAAALSAAGISIVVVWETAANRSLDGHAAGAEDARDALAEAKACGMPDGRPIYFAVDFDASAGQEAAIAVYLDGAASVLGKDRTGVYGGYAVVKHALDGNHCRWAWQTYAWSASRWDTRAQLQQYSNDHVIGGVGLDYDRSERDDFGQWRIGWTPNVTPTPSPDPAPTTKDDDMAAYGDVNKGTDHTNPTVRALPRGRYSNIGFIADNGVQGLPPASLRVAIHTTDDHGKGAWDVHHNVIVDSSGKQVVVHFDDQAHTDGISILHEDATAVKDHTLVDVNGAVNVSYEIS
jgi:hypothetical protein